MYAGEALILIFHLCHGENKKDGHGMEKQRWETHTRVRSLSLEYQAEPPSLQTGRVLTSVNTFSTQVTPPAFSWQGSCDSWQV